MATSSVKMEKITISVPSELKEIQKWQKAAELASKDEEYMKFVQEMNNSVY